MEAIDTKSSWWGLSCLILFMVVFLPIALFRVGYKFNFVSKELFLLVLLDLLVVVVVLNKSLHFKIQLSQLLLCAAAVPVFICNFSSPHMLSVFSLYLLFLILVPYHISVCNIFVCLAWASMISIVFSFYQYWSTAYGVVPFWLKLANQGSRMAGLFGQPNLQACLVVIGLFAWLQVLFNRFGSSGWRWFYQLPVTIFFWALLLTGSKAGMLAFVSALLLASWGLLRAGEIKLLIFLIIQFAWSLSLGLLLFFLIQPPGIAIIGDRAIDFAEQSMSTGSRLIYGGSAISMGLDNLWLGAGLGGYRRLLGGYMAPVAEWLHIPYDSIKATLWAHNDFLHVFAECGLLVFLLFLLVFLMVMFKVFPKKNIQALFCFCAIWSFFVFMQFGHPFNDHVLVFFLVLLFAGALQLFPECFTLNIPFKLIILFLVPCLLLTNLYILSYARDMFHLKGYLKSVSEITPLKVDRLTYLRDKYHYDDLVQDSLVGWEFKYAHLQALGNYAVQNFDTELAVYLIPEFEDFQSEHDSYALNYMLSRLYFLARNYTTCKKTADIAYLLKPDMYHYSNFGHICLVFDISKREKIPVTQLISSEYFSELEKNKVFSMDMLDENFCAI
jgi:hypothetical protein